MTAVRSWARRQWVRNETLRGLVLLAPALLLMLALMIVPLILVVAQSFWTQDGLILDRTPSLTNYAKLLTGESANYWRLLLKSIQVSFIAAAVVVVLAYPVAYFMAFGAGRSKILWLILIIIPFWISYLLRVFSWKVILGFNGVINAGLKSLGLTTEPLEALLYNQTAVTITLAHTWAAFAVLPIYVSLQKIDRTLFEASADLGDTGLKRFWRVTLPLSMPGIATAFVLVFVPTVGDYITPQLVGGTSGVMVGTAIASLFGKENDAPLGAALAVVMMAATGLLLLAMFAVARRIGLWRRAD